MNKKNILILYHTEYSGATKSIMLLKNYKQRFFYFLKIPIKLKSSSIKVLKNFKRIMNSRFIIINGIAVIKNPLILVLCLFLERLNKNIFLYFHETNWLWKKSAYKNIYIKYIHHYDLLDKKINQMIKNSKIIADSNYCANWIRNRFHNNSEIEILYEAINFKKIWNLSNKRNPKISNGKFLVIMAIGVLSRRKGFKVFLEIADKAPNNYKFIWVGKIKPIENSEQKLIKKINRKSGYEKIILMDFNPNPYPLLKKCDLFFLPSLDEPFGIAYLEALALGKFIICPYSTGFSEIIYNKNKLGLVYKRKAEVIELLKSNDIKDYINNYYSDRIEMAKKFDRKFFFRKLIRIILKYQ